MGLQWLSPQLFPPAGRITAPGCLCLVSDQQLWPRGALLMWGGHPGAPGGPV